MAPGADRDHVRTICKKLPASTRGNSRGQSLLRQSARPVQPARRRRGWGYGAMGFARAGRARGSRTFSISSRLKPEAIEIVFNGADGPVYDKVPDFIKSIPVWRAIDEIDADRLRDERRAAAAFQRLSRPPHRARLDRHLLDEASHQHHGAHPAARRILDEAGLPHPARQIPDRGPHLPRRKTPPARRSRKSWSIR